MLSRVSLLILLASASFVRGQDSSRSVFVAAGHFGSRMVSEDGKNWSKPVLGKEGETYRVLKFDRGQCLAAGSFGGDNIFAVTRDGQAWKTSKTEAKYVNYVRCLTTGNGAFLAIVGDAGSIPARCLSMQSTDGLTWPEPKSIAGKAMLRRAVFAEGKFVAVGDFGRRSVSVNGKEWTDAPNAKALDTLIDVAHGGGTFVGVGLHGLRMSSQDGLKWENRQVGAEGEHLNTILWTGDRFVAIGQGATYLSTDGAKWVRELNVNAPTIATYGNGVFVGAKWRGRLLHSTDAIVWTETLQTEHPIEAVAFGALQSKK
jgi:hypothetical protein